MNIVRCLVVLLWLCPWPPVLPPLHAADPPGRGDVTFESISLAEGLSQVTINTIVKDKNGFMWFGAMDGLNRYDGYGFKIYRNDPDNPNSLPDNQLRVIRLDRESNLLWIGADSAGLSCFDPASETFVNYPYGTADASGLSGGAVYALYVDRDNTVWAGTLDGGGLNRLNREDGTFTHFTHDPGDPHSLSHNNVRAVFEDKNGVLWVGTYHGGLNEMDRHTGRFTRYRHDPRRPHTLSSDRVMDIVEDGSGNLWIATDGGGVNRFNREAGVFTCFRCRPGDPGSLSHDRVKALCVGRDDTLWVATYGGGLNRFDAASETFTAFRYDHMNLKSLPDNQLTALYEDDTRLLWIGSYGKGVAKMDPHKKKFDLYLAVPSRPETLGFGKVRAILEDSSGALWLGTNGRGVSRFDRSTGAVTMYRHDPDDPTGVAGDRVYALHEDKAGDIWVGTFGGGLDKFDKKTGVFIHHKPDPRGNGNISHHRIRSICEDHAGALWVATWDGGLNRFDRKTGRFTAYHWDPDDPHSLGYDKMYCVVTDRSGVVWAGARGGGLSRYNHDTDNFTRFQHEPGNPDSLSHNRVLCIHEDQTGMLWVGTAGGGLNRFDRENNRWTAYTTKQGLPNNIIYGILEDENGRLWLSSNSGLTDFDPATGNTRNYDAADGLQGSEFAGGAYFKNRRGEMFFGGVNGFNSFHPHLIEDNPYVPPVVITQFKKFNRPVKSAKPISLLKEIRLSHKDNYISFEFTALNYRATQKNRYMYMLEGFDKDWIHSGDRRTAGYTNLKGGRYRFRVRASNNDGLWNTEGASVAVYIEPPFWVTWWFRLAVLLTVSAVIFLVYRYRVHRIRRRNIQLEEINRKLNEEIADRKRSEARNLELQEQLLNAKRLESVGTLAGGMAHEFNNLMSTIIGNAGMLQVVMEGSPPLRKRVESILRASTRCASLTDQLLSFGRKQVLKLEKLDLNAVIKSLDRDIRDAAPEGIGIEFQLQPQLEPVAADRDMMNQMVMGIVHNAVDAMPDGGKLSIRTQVIEGNQLHQQSSLNRTGMFVRLTIADTGIGMDEETLRHIFEPFYTTKEVGKGTGLALSFVYGTVSQHNGSIHVDSAVGEGTTVTIYFPTAA